jgi:hypothetical protein
VTAWRVTLPVAESDVGVRMGRKRHFLTVWAVMSHEEHLEAEAREMDADFAQQSFLDLYVS